MLRKIFSFFLLFVIVHAAYSQVASDTVRLDLGQAEELFLKNNLALIAEKYNIEASRVNILQAGLWSNPILYIEQNIYNPNNKKYFDYKKSGENIVQIQQLFLLAGKRNKRIKLQEVNLQIAEFQFYDVLRTLKFELRTNFFNLYFLEQIITVYDQEIVSVTKMVEAYSILYSHGNVSLKELMRLKALLFSLQKEKLDVTTQIFEVRSNMRILFNDTLRPYIIPQVKKEGLDSIDLKKISLKNLTETALANRADLKIYEADLDYEQKNLAYQRALAIPDLQLGGVYDRQGNFVRNYTAAGVQVNVPIFNRNQHNIQISKIKIKQNKVALQAYSYRVENEVTLAYLKTLEQQKLLGSIDTSFSSTYKKLMEGVTQNYQSKNISLIEFIDFYEAYKTSTIQLNQLERDKINSFELINYYSGKDVINYK